MGFHEDDRIRRKNTESVKGITEDSVILKLNHVSVAQLVESLSNSGLKVELSSDQTISVYGKSTHEKKVKHANNSTSVLQSNLVSGNGSTRAKDK